MKNIILLLTLVRITTVLPAQTAVQAWAQRYDGPGNTNDFAAAIAADTNGNVFVTGFSTSDHQVPFIYASATIKYSSAGEPLWTNRFVAPGNVSGTASAMTVDPSGNVLVTGLSYATVKYSNGGVPLWTNRYNGPMNQDTARAIAVDGSGNVFVTGTSKDANGYPDYATVAYSSLGLPLWTNRYGDAAGNFDEAKAIAVDTNGNVFVTGYSARYPSYNDFATIKYSSTGAPAWTNFFSSSGAGDDKANAIAVDSSGNVLVTGSSPWNGEIRDYHGYVTIKYSGAGQPLWTNGYGVGTTLDNPVAIAVDGNDSSYVTGYSYAGGGRFDYDYATIKYSSAGVPLWTNQYNGPANSDDYARAISVDGHGSVFVSGNSAGINGYTTIAYSTAGLPLWTNYYKGPGNGSGGPAGMVMDRDGNVFVTGSLVGNGNDFDYATVKYSIWQIVPLGIQQQNNQLMLSWTNAALGLQSAPTISGTFTNIPSATSPYTNPITGAQQFFRLILK